MTGSRFIGLAALFVAALAPATRAACPSTAPGDANTCYVHPSGTSGGTGALGQCTGGGAEDCCETADCPGVETCTAVAPSCQTMDKAQQTMVNGDTVSIWPGAYTSGYVPNATANTYLYQGNTWIYPDRSACTGTCNFTFQAYDANDPPIFMDGILVGTDAAGTELDLLTLTNINGLHLRHGILTQPHPNVSITGTNVRMGRYMRGDDGSTFIRVGKPGGSSYAGTFNFTNLELFPTALPDPTLVFSYDPGAYPPQPYSSQANNGHWIWTDATTWTCTDCLFSSPQQLHRLAGTYATYNGLILNNIGTTNHGFVMYNSGTLSTIFKGENWLVTTLQSMAGGKCGEVTANICNGGPQHGFACSDDNDCLGCGYGANRYCGSSGQESVITTTDTMGDDLAERRPWGAGDLCNSRVSPTACGGADAVKCDTTGGRTPDTCYRGPRLIDFYDCGTPAESCFVRNSTFVNFGSLQDLIHIESPNTSFCVNDDGGDTCEPYFEFYNNLLYGRHYAGFPNESTFFHYKDGASWGTRHIWHDGNLWIADTIHVPGMDDEDEHMYDPIQVYNDLGWFCGNESGQTRDSAWSFRDWQDGYVEGTGDTASPVTFDFCEMGAQQRDPHSYFIADDAWPNSSPTLGGQLFAGWSTIDGPNVQDFRASRATLIAAYAPTASAAQLIDKGIHGICSTTTSGCTGVGCLDGNIACTGSGLDRVCPRCTPGVSTCTGGTCNAASSNSITYCAATDINGDTRDDDFCDIGAFEFAAGAPPTEIDLSIVKTADDMTPDVLSNITFTVTLTNAAGTAQATGVVVRDLLASGYAYVSDNSGTTGTTYSDSTGDWTVGTLNAGANIALEIVATVQAGGSYVNSAEVWSANETDSDSTPADGTGDDFDTITPVPGTPYAGPLFYVNDATGSDTNEGSSGSPWKTIAKCNQEMDPGETCVIHTGTYADDIQPSNSGTLGNLITYKPAGDGDVTLARSCTGPPPDVGCVNLYNKAYVRVTGAADGDDADCSDGSCIRRIKVRPTTFSELMGNLCGASYSTIENVDFGGATKDSNATRGVGFCIDFWTSTGHESQYNVFRGNLVNCIESGATASDRTEDCVSLSQNAHHNLLEYNTINGAWHVALHANNSNHAAGETPHDNVVRFNTVTNTNHTALSFYGVGPGWLVEGNTLSASGAAPASAKGAGNGIQWNAADSILRYNLVSLGGSTDNTHNDIGGIALLAGGDGDQAGNNLRVYNNTSVKSGGPALIVGCYPTCPAVGDNVFVNNVVYDPENSSTSFEATHYRDEDLVAGGINDDWRSNFIGEPNGGDPQPLPATAVVWTEGASAQTAAAAEGNSGPTLPTFSNILQPDPGFASYAGSDYTLLTTSALIDAGEHLTTTVGAGSSSTSMVVADARFFHDGKGIVDGDWIAFGTTFASPTVTQISAVDYGTNTLTIPASDWGNGDKVWLYRDSRGTIVTLLDGPDVGYWESPSKAGGPGPEPTPSAATGVSFDGTGKN